MSHGRHGPFSLSAMADEAPARATAPLPEAARLDPRNLWTLLAGNALVVMGIGFFLPILPLFIASRGGSPLLVGFVFGAGVAGRALAQYPGGWLADRYGRRPVIIGALLLYAFGFPLYALPMPAALLIALRFAHALISGPYMPAASALVADLTDPLQRGRAFGRLRASDMVGLLLGPALGGLVAGFRLEAVFLAAGGVCLLAVALLARLPSPPLRREETAAVPVGAWPLLWLLLPVVALGAPIYWTFGIYDSVWSLYITSRGATPFLVGLSFATYALPIVLFSSLAGSLADRLGTFRAGALAVLTFGLLALTYPFIASVWALILLGFVEGALTAAGNPALMAEVSRSAPTGAQGRAQGVYGAAINAAQVLGAVTAGGLYGLRPAYPFLAACAVCLLGVASSLVLRSTRSRSASWTPHD